jgi:hypothetical protein
MGAQIKAEQEGHFGDGRARVREMPRGKLEAQLIQQRPVGRVFVGERSIQRPEAHFQTGRDTGRARLAVLKELLEHGSDAVGNGCRSRMASNSIFRMAVDERRQHGIGALTRKTETSVRDDERVLARGEADRRLKKSCVLADIRRSTMGKPYFVGIPVAACGKASRSATRRR